MRSESTSALGQPKLTNPTFGVLRLTDFKLFRGVAGSGENCTPKSPLPADNAIQGPFQAARRCSRTVKLDRLIMRLGANKSRRETLLPAQELRRRSDKDFGMCHRSTLGGRSAHIGPKRGRWLNF